MGVFWQRCRRPGPACGLRRRFCAHLFAVLESRPSSAQHSVVGPPVEMMQSAAPRGLAELRAMRRMTAAEAHRRLASGCNGHGKRQVLAGGGYRRGAGGRHPWARAKPLKGDPAMQLLGQEPLRRGRTTGGRQDSCAVHDPRASDGESAPWRQDARAVYSPTALCGSFWTHSTHILPKLAVFEYMQAICCHEPVFFPSGAPSGTHRGAILPRPAARERIGAISCHGQAPNDRPEAHRRLVSDCNGYLRPEPRGAGPPYPPPSLGRENVGSLELVKRHTEHLSTRNVSWIPLLKPCGERTHQRGKNGINGANVA